MGETHSTRALTQLAHGSLRSHLTFRCWHNTHGCFLRFWDSSGRSEVGKRGETVGLVAWKDIAVDSASDARQSRLGLYSRRQSPIACACRPRQAIPDSLQWIPIVYLQIRLADFQDTDLNPLSGSQSHMYRKTGQVDRCRSGDS